MIALFLLIVIPLVSGASWSAYVLDNSSVGINAANVTAVLNVGDTYVNSTLTDGAGFFNLSIPDATSVRLITSKTSYKNDTSIGLPSISFDAMLPFNVTLIPETTGNITGKIVDPVGTGIANATVEAIQANITKGSDITNSRQKIYSSNSAQLS